MVLTYQITLPKGMNEYYVGYDKNVHKKLTVMEIVSK